MYLLAAIEGRGGLILQSPFKILVLEVSLGGKCLFFFHGGFFGRVPDLSEAIL